MDRTEAEALLSMDVDDGELTDDVRHEAKRSAGLFTKFEVTRVDGRDRIGCKHDGCRYFVLDLTHDPFAQAAVRAYADVCRKEYPQLAADLGDWLLDKHIEREEARRRERGEE
jgi:hypothetical protein